MRTRPDVYKFWLGLCEKLFVLLVAATVVPVVVGQLRFRLPIAIFDLIALIGLGVALGMLTRKLWDLEEREEEDGL